MDRDFKFAAKIIEMPPKKANIYLLCILFKDENYDSFGRN